MEENNGYQVDGEIKVGGSIKLKSPSGSTYDMTIGKDGAHACSCPAYQFRGTCKHVNYLRSCHALTKTEEQSDFTVKGKPSFANGDRKDTAKANLQTILKQRIEEARQQDKQTRKFTPAHSDAEFKPENIPFIPDSNHPLLSKHTLATVERNAGYPDRSSVPAMYQAQMPPLKGSEVVLERIPAPSQELPPPGTDFGTESEYHGRVEPTTATGTSSGTETQTKAVEFELKVPRANMNRGGYYMPNESRPYRPGDTK